MVLPIPPRERSAALRALLQRLEGRLPQPPNPAELQELLDQLPPPDESLFADPGGAPLAADAAAALGGAADFLQAAALHLQLLARLVEALDAASMGLDALAAEAQQQEEQQQQRWAQQPLQQAAAEGAGAGGRVGPVLIEEMDDDGIAEGEEHEEEGQQSSGATGPGPDAGLPVGLLLAAAQYCSDPRLQRPWASPQTAYMAQQLLLNLSAKAARTLQQATGGSQTAEVEGPHGLQELALLCMPRMLGTLRPTLLARKEHEGNPYTRLEIYAGPGTFERCLAAGQLAWLLRQLGGPALGAALAQALPYLLACAEDAAPAVQACSLWALHHCALAASEADLRPYREALLGTARRALSSCDDHAWPAAAATAAAVALKLEGSNPYGRGLEGVLTAFLEEGARCQHLPARAAVWLEAVPAFIPALGLLLARHLARLLPLLLGWAQAVQRSLRVAALRTLCEALRHTWPRVPAHAPAIWPVLRAVHLDEVAISGQPHPAVVEAAVQCALLLWCAAGADFQHSMLVAPGAREDTLLLAVMARVEAGASDTTQPDAAGGSGADPLALGAAPISMVAG